MSSTDACLACLAPYALVAGALLYILSRLLVNGNWTFEVLAAKHDWDAREKARCCRNAAVVYFATSAALFFYGRFNFFVQRWLNVCMARLRRRGSTTRAALLGRDGVRHGQVPASAAGMMDVSDAEEEYWYDMRSTEGVSDRLRGRGERREMTVPLAADPSVRLGIDLRLGDNSSRSVDATDGGGAGFPSALHGVRGATGHSQWDARDGNIAADEKVSDGIHFSDVTVVSGEGPRRSAFCRAGYHSPDDDEFNSDTELNTTLQQQQRDRQRAFMSMQGGASYSGRGEGGLSTTALSAGIGSSESVRRVDRRMNAAGAAKVRACDARRRRWDVDVVASGSPALLQSDFSPVTTSPSPPRQDNLAPAIATRATEAAAAAMMGSSLTNPTSAAHVGPPPAQFAPASAPRSARVNGQNANERAPSGPFQDFGSC